MPATDSFAQNGPSGPKVQEGRQGRPVESALSFAARKEQQLAFLLTRQLAEAQFQQADAVRSRRLWQEVAALELDPERITALLFEVSDHADNAEMEAVDQRFACRVPRGLHGFWSALGRRRLPRRRWDGAWPRSAPRAESPVRREGH